MKIVNILFCFNPKKNEKNREKYILLNNTFQNNSLLYNNHMNNSTKINEAHDYLINNSDYLMYSQFYETSK